jgi:glycosyltransferase involved in cell wall biosynthesis
MIKFHQKYIKNPTISVIVITYNQEETISQTIDSILSQECDYTFEIIIGDDCSSDKTLQICLDYQSKHKEIIKLLSQDNNRGLIQNYADVLSLCNGDFIAQCAGDDYWCDNKKLQKQCDFLLNNTEYGFVRTGNYNLNFETGKISKGDYHSTATGNVFEIAKYGTIASAPTILFRRNLLKLIDFEEFIRRRFSVEDYPLQAIMAKNTLFGYLPDFTAVYRQSAGTISKPQSREKKLRYLEGFLAVKCYLAELYPLEFDYNPIWVKNEMAHKKLQFAYEDFDFFTAKKSVDLFVEPNSKERKLIKYTENIVIFYAACLYKFLLKKLK